MKKNLYLLTLLGMLIFSIPVLGQKTVVKVAPDAGLDIGALNDAIDAVDPSELDNTIFELERNGLYLLNGSISHIGYTLHIRTEAGEGSKAVLQPAVDETGESSRQLQPSGNLILEGIYLQGRDELGNINSQPLRVLGDNLTILVDDCVFDYAAQSLIRTSSSGNTIKVTNSILRNSLLPDNPSNGRVIDSRGNPNDTLWISNSTIYNNGATQLRSDGGATNYAKFDHNTVFQTSFAHNMALDYIFKADITNNVFYNFLYRGNNMDHSAFFAVDSIFGEGSEADDEIGYTDAGRYFDLSNNNWYVDDTIGYIMDEYGPDTLVMYYEWDELEENPIPYRQALRTNWFVNESLMAMNPAIETPDIVKFIANGQVDTTGLFREMLEFKNPPPLNLDYWKFYTENGWAITGMETPNAYADEDPNVLGEVQTGAFDFSYNSNSRSATAAKDGTPLGAARWTPYTPVSVNNSKINQSIGLSTHPNPFIDEVTFNMKMKDGAQMKIQIFDLVGKEVYSEIKNVNAGNNEIKVNLGTKTNAGIYLYKVQIETSAGTRSISSGKIMKR